MRKHLSILEFATLTISQQHNEIIHLLDEQKSERISSSVMELMEVIMEIENEYNNQPNNRGGILERDVLSDLENQEADS